MNYVFNLFIFNLNFLKLEQIMEEKQQVEDQDLVVLRCCWKSYLGCNLGLCIYLKNWISFNFVSCTLPSPCLSRSISASHHFKCVHPSSIQHPHNILYFIDGYLSLSLSLRPSLSLDSSLIVCPFALSMISSHPLTYTFTQSHSWTMKACRCSLTP